MSLSTPGTRFKTTHDFGHVTLDINSVVPEDAGVYMCKAVNKAGEAITSTSIKIIGESSPVCRVLGGSIEDPGSSVIQACAVPGAQMVLRSVPFYDTKVSTLREFMTTVT